MHALYTLHSIVIYMLSMHALYTLHNIVIYM